MEMYKSFNTNSDIVTDVPTRVTYGLWSGGIGTLTNMVTGSVTKYYGNIHNTTSSNDIEFSIAIGHKYGSGSSGDYDYPTKAVYEQYRNLLLSDANSEFYADGTNAANALMFLSVNRQNIKQRVDPGNWELHLKYNNRTYKFIDDSGDSQDTGVNTNNVYNIVSGTISTGQSGTNQFGLFYPNAGVFAFDLGLLVSGSGFEDYRTLAGFVPFTSSFNPYSVTQSVQFVTSGSYFSARSEEYISSNHYFIRLFNNEFNYSTNPTFYSGSEGRLTVSSFASDPHTFPTTVGLYNENNELLAVAKLSKPINKSFTKEAIIQIRLDF